MKHPELVPGQIVGALKFIQREKNISVPSKGIRGYQHRQIALVNCNICGSNKYVNYMHLKQKLIGTCGQLLCKQTLRNRRKNHDQVSKTIYC